MGFESDWPLLRERIDDGFILHELKPDLRRLYLEVTTRCNLSCRACMRETWNEEPGDMELDLVAGILDQLPDLPRLSHLYLGGYGEPLLHPGILEILDRIGRLELKTLITTNGMLLRGEILRGVVEAGVHDLIISCDSLNAEDFARIRRGGELRTVYENMAELNRLKGRAQSARPRLNLEFILMRENRDQLEDIPALAGELGISSVLVTNLLPHTRTMADQILYTRGGNGTPFAPVFWTNGGRGWFAQMGNMKFPRMEWGAHRRCPFIERKSALIGRDGGVSPCYPLAHAHRDYIFGRKKEVARYTLGNVADRDLLAIWKDPEYVKFRGRVRDFRFPSCEDCRIRDACEYTASNEDCWGSSPSCADCLWAQDIIRCP